MLRVVILLSYLLFSTVCFAYDFSPLYQSNHQIKWYVATQNKMYSPILTATNIIYAIHRSEKTNTYQFLGINPDGSQKWQLILTKNYYRLPPVVDQEGNIYLSSADSHVTCISDNGNIKWSVPIHGFSYTQLVSDDNTLYTTSISPTGNWITAIKDGAIKWQTKVNAAPDIGDSLVQAPDKTIYTADSKYVYALTPAGKIKWTFDSGETTPYMEDIILSLNKQDGTLYARNNMNMLFALTPDGKLKWRAPFITSNIEKLYSARNGILYAISNDTTVFNCAKIYAINTDGHLLWSKKFAGLITLPLIFDDEGNCYFVIQGLYQNQTDSIYKITEQGKLLLHINASYYYPTIQSLRLVNGLLYVTYPAKPAGRISVYNKNGEAICKYDYLDILFIYLSDSDPVVSQDGTIYFRGDTQGIYALQPCIALDENK